MHLPTWSVLGRHLVLMFITCLACICTLLLTASDIWDGDELWKGAAAGVLGYIMRNSGDLGLCWIFKKEAS